MSKRPGRPRLVFEPGSVFGRLTIIGRADTVGGYSFWTVWCSCGKIKNIRASDIGKVLSCGCLREERVAAACTTHGHATGGELHPLYRTWVTMKQRCYNPRFHKYADYGARGIKVCERWRDSFEAFLGDMGPKPSPRHTLDRKENDGDYTPENCRWATSLEQGANKRSNVRLEYDGRTQSISEWARELGIKAGTISYRIRKGWSVAETLTKVPAYGNRL